MFCLFAGLSRDVEGDTTPEYQPPDLPDMDIKPDMMKCVKTDPVSAVSGAGDNVYRHGQYRGHGDTGAGTGAETTGYNIASTVSSSGQTWSQHSQHQYSTSLQQQQQQMSLGVAASTVPYTAGYCTSQRELTGDDFRDGEDDSNIDLKTGRDEIGHYDNDMISQTGPIRGYPGRADGFVWRPY